MNLTGIRSAFPARIDEIQELFNIPSSLQPELVKYQELILKETLTESEISELELLQTKLAPYIFSVEKWNQFGDILVNMQKFFKQGVEPYIQKHLEDVDDKVAETKKIADQLQKDLREFVESEKTEFQSGINDLTFVGSWKAKVDYYKNNIVEFDGKSFIAKQDNKGSSPHETSADWGLIAKKGEKGDPSLNISFKGEYNPNMLYTLGDAVIYEKLWYYALEEVQGVSPVNSDKWVLQNNQVYKGATKPFDNNINFWIDTN